MSYQRTFAFEGASCPKYRSEFWFNIEATVRVCWGDCFISEIDYESQGLGKRKVLKVIITAKTICHLANSCYELGSEIGVYKSKHSNFKFFEVIFPESFNEDETQNVIYRRKTTSK